MSSERVSPLQLYSVCFHVHDTLEEIIEMEDREWLSECKQGKWGGREVGIRRYIEKRQQEGSLWYGTVQYLDCVYVN